MNPLIYAACALSFGAIAVLLHAILSAPNGFEDEEGFHAIRPSGVPEDPLTADERTRGDGGRGFVSTP